MYTYVSRCANASRYANTNPHMANATMRRPPISIWLTPRCANANPHMANATLTLTPIPNPQPPIPKDTIKQA